MKKEEIKKSVVKGFLLSVLIAAYLIVGNGIENAITAYIRVTNRYYLIFVVSVIYGMVFAIIIRVFFMFKKREKDKKQLRANFTAISSFLFLSIFGVVTIINGGIRVIANQIYILSIWLSLFFSIERE